MTRRDSGYVWLLIGAWLAVGPGSIAMLGCNAPDSGLGATGRGRAGADPASDDPPLDGTSTGEPGLPSNEAAPADAQQGDAVDDTSQNDQPDEPRPEGTSDDTPLGDDFDDPPQDDMLDDTPNAAYLDTLTLGHARAGGRIFLVWVADLPSERQRGLMNVTAEEMAPLPDGRRRGMLFVFDRDETTGFWMRNTIIPLDIAFIRQNGSIVTIHTMTPLDESIYPPDGPYRYALEVNAGAFAELGVEAGDLVELPQQLPKVRKKSLTP